jgi:hypothetical protein
MNAVVLLLYRNLVASVDKVFLVWQVLFPIVYIFIAGYSYSALIGGQGVPVGAASIAYPAFLAAGMIGFNVMNSSTISGSIIWNDKRNGMFQQILVMPFARMEYIAGNILTIMLMGLASAVWTEEAKHLSIFHVKGHAVDCMHLPVGLAQVGNVDAGLHRRIVRTAPILFYGRGGPGDHF